MLTTYEQHYKTYKDMQERQQQKLTPPEFGENLIRFKKHTSGYIINDDSEYQDANSVIRSFILFGIAMAILAIMVLYLPGVHFEDIFAGGVKK